MRTTRGCCSWAGVGGRWQERPRGSACLPGSCSGAGRVGHRVLGGDRQPPLLPLPPPAPGEWGLPSSLLAPCCPKPPLCVWLEHPAAGSSSSAPSRPGGFWGCHNDGWLLGSCQDLSRLGIPGCVGSAVSPRHQGPPGHHLRASDGNSQGGPLPYLTPCSAALPCPALAGCPAAQHVAKPHCQVAYRDPMALDTNWCRLPKMNNVITGITVKCSCSHSLNAETGPLGPSGEHLLQLCPLPATHPIVAQVAPLAPITPHPAGVAGVALC